MVPRLIQTFTVKSTACLLKCIDSKESIHLCTSVDKLVFFYYEVALPAKLPFWHQGEAAKTKTIIVFVNYFNV